MPERPSVSEEENSYSLGWKAVTGEKKQLSCFVPMEKSPFIKLAILGESIVNNRIVRQYLFRVSSYGFQVKPVSYIVIVPQNILLLQYWNRRSERFGLTNVRILLYKYIKRE